MKNKLSDLNDHLFAQLERLSDEDLKGKKLAEECDRAKSIQGISKEIIDGGKLMLAARVNYGGIMEKSTQRHLGISNA